MSTKAERGIKRTCQNPECGARFYDLNRDPIVCPICQTMFQLTAQEGVAAVGAGQEGPGARAAARRPAYQVGAAEKPADAPVSEEDEDALPALESDDEPEAAEEDETFLEPEEEDGSDMENIIGGPVAETDEPDR
jgi:uncharacterized protein (TIGR02300 family)